MSGSNRPWGVAALSLAALIAFSVGAFAAGDAHEHGGGEAKLVLDHGKKWKTDETARKGMDAIRSALAADLKTIHTGKQTDVQYQALAQKLNSEVANMVQNCKLDPKADEQFHVVLTQMMAAAEMMEGKHAGEVRRKGAEQAARALNDYGRHFEHPGWRRL